MSKDAAHPIPAPASAAGHTQALSGPYGNVKDGGDRHLCSNKRDRDDPCPIEERPMVDPPKCALFPHRHLLGIEGLSAQDIEILLSLSEAAIEVSRQVEKKRSTLRGRTLINLFFETSTRTQSSFELAGKRLGADVMNMSVATSSVKKGETLLNTAVTLNAMHPDIIVVRHAQAGAVHLLAKKVDCAVVNAGDGAHEHPTQALLDALTIRRNKGKIEGLTS